MFYLYTAGIDKQRLVGSRKVVGVRTVEGEKARDIYSC